MNDKLKGILLIILGAFFFSIMATFVKSLPNTPLVEKIFFRNIIGLFAITISIKKSKKSFKPTNLKLIVLRSTFGLLGISFYYYSLTSLKLANAVIINKLSPFFMIIIAAIVLKERITPAKIISIILALAGAALVIKPNLSYEVIPALIGVLGAISAASAYITLRKLSATDSPSTIIFYFTLICTVVTLPIMLNGNFIMPSILDFMKLIMIGLSALGGQLCITNGYRYAPASELGIYSYTNIIFSTIIGVSLFKEIPDYLSLLGGLLIISGAIYNYLLAKKAV